MGKIERIRFTIQDDLNLLRNVLGINPYQNYRDWKIVHQNVCKISGKNFTVRAVREHMDHLLKLFIKEDRANLRKSGTEEQYEEKERLLQEIKELSREFQRNSNNIEKKKEESKQKSSESRNTATVVVPEVNTKAELEPLDYVYLDYQTSTANQDLETQGVIQAPPDKPEVSDTLKEPANSQTHKQPILGPIRTRKCRSAGLQYLKKKLNWEKRLKEKELELQERRLAVEERKLQLDENRFELEKKERERRLEIEIKEREQKINLSQQQQDTINFFIKHFSKKQPEKKM